MPADVAGPVLVLLEDTTPLATALGAGPVTLAHGDLATVNMAFDGDDLVLLDWALPTAAPGALDIAWFLAGCSSVLEPSRERRPGDLRARLAGPAYDESARCGSPCWRAWCGWAGTRRWTRPSIPIPRAVSGSARDLDWWVRRPGDDPGERSALMDLEHAVPPHGRELGGPGQRRPADQWDGPTPCREWTVRDLVNHVAGEDLWTAPLMQGQHDRGGGRPVRRRPARRRPDPERARRRARGDPQPSPACCPQGGTVHLSYGEEQMDEYVHQLAADHLVHGWDLAVGDRR